MTKSFGVSTALIHGSRPAASDVFRFEYLEKKRKWRYRKGKNILPRNVESNHQDKLWQHTFLQNTGMLKGYISLCRLHDFKAVCLVMLVNWFLGLGTKTTWLLFGKDQCFVTTNMVRNCSEVSLKIIQWCQTLKHNYWPQHDMLNYVLHVKTSQYQFTHNMEVLIWSRQINWDLIGQFDLNVIAEVLHVSV